MNKTKGKKWLSVILTIIMVFSLIPAFAFASTTEGQEAENSDYSSFLLDLKVLEQYADTYAKEHAGEDPIALVINYVRCGVEKYTSGTWTTFCGEEKIEFTNFVSEQDVLNNTTAGRLRSLAVFTLPNGDEVEFAHMFGCMDMAYHTGNQSTADLGSWAGDICDLIQLTYNDGVTGTVEEMAELIRTENDKYFLYDDPEAHSFGRLDLYGDLDAFYILHNLTSGKTISAIMENYFTDNLTDSIRANFFVKNRFPEATTKEQIRSVVYSTYCNNEGLKTLEGTYVPTGVNADLRQACCYAFADYLYEITKERLSNPYYNVFSEESQILAPGVTQTIKKALTADDKQIVYYIATADISRSDVDVYANYNDNDGSQWKMSRVTDQMASAQEKHSNPDDIEHYIPNYIAVAGVNADFYNMSNGAPSGALVMEGTTYQGANGSNFFGVLKDGTPIIGGSTEWNIYKDEIQEAVGASIWLVKNGEIVPNKTDNYYADRASRTCVGITYDGKVVLMALDGRQEPFSAGGSAIEIAQIMLDAGCVSAVNLDGGGSTTFAAREEGDDQVTVVNRPSDGYERSVSSSLLVVSTAKPSNEFDHAVISAEYDYLTVGTELEIEVAGVTSTGSAIALPEGSTLKLSDESIGKLSDDSLFTAEKLGDVQIQLVDTDGKILGTKNLHVVEPTDLTFTKESINVVYGEPTNLPLLATYNGNAVKINPSDVQFGFLKVTLQSIGNLGDDGDVNTTKTELVFGYPEAGTIDGFAFTGNEDGGLRNVTVGAVLQNKMEEFTATVEQEFMKAYQEALDSGLSDDLAIIQAKGAAVNKALDTAARLTIYFYDADEAKFDFDEATDGSKLLAWKREVSNAEYKEDQKTYFIIERDQNMEVSYTFAVDMTKVPIPEKLSGLLYMLPGGDQEGRTAWDFLMQLAERVSPLTTVTVTLTVPQGVEIDTSDLRFANEYFTLTSTEVEGNKLIVTCNFIEQSQSINPATANPLCVLSGLKLIPTEDADWDENNCLTFEASGSVEYDIYAHFHILESLAQQPEYQEMYGLYPYNNTANIPGDSGAHFMNSVEDFSDTFLLNKGGKDGWVQEDGNWFFYEGGTKLAGIHELPSNLDGESGVFWYDLGEDGISKGKITGLFEFDNALYYATNGELKTGWRVVTDEEGEERYYYFDSETKQAVDGTYEVDKLTYTFENHILVRGALITDNIGKRYYWAGEQVKRKWCTIDGKQYYFYWGDGYALTGLQWVERANSNQGSDLYLFGDDGALITTPGLTFVNNADRDIVYLDENGMAIYAGLVQDDEGNYYYIDGNLKAVKDGLYWVTKTNDLMKSGLQREFDKDGKMVVKNGIYTDSTGLVYYINDDLQAGNGLVQMADGRMIYVKDYGNLAVGNFQVTKTNGLLPPGTYYFDNGGILQLDGWITNENGTTYYKENVKAYLNSWAEIDGQYYYFDEDGYIVKGVERVPYPEASFLSGYGPDAEDAANNPGTTNLYIYPDAKDALFVFDEETGKFQLTLKGTYDDNGIIRWIENGQVIWHAGLVQDENGDYYYFTRSGIVKNQEYYIAKTHDLLPAAKYIFGEDGKLMKYEGLYEDLNGDLCYFVKYVKTYAGLVQDKNGAYYYIASDMKAVKDCAHYILNEKANGLLPAGTYKFDEDGRMIILNGLVKEDGEVYFYENNVRVYAGLVQDENGDYYYINSSLKAVKNQIYTITKTNGKLPAGNYEFDEDGKLIMKNGIYKEADYLFYYIDNEIQVGTGLVQMEDGSYIYVRSGGNLATGQYYVTKNNNLLPSGTYTFGEDGRMIE